MWFAGSAGYAKTDNFARIQIKNCTKIEPIAINSEICNIAAPNQIGICGKEIVLQEILLLHPLPFFEVLLSIWMNAAQFGFLHDRIA